MTSGNYGGVEIPSVVLDISSSSTRIGYAGEDIPRNVFTTSMGKRTDSGEFLGGLKDSISWAPNVDVANPFKDGEIVNWEVYEAVWAHSFNKALRQGSNEYPVLCTEYSWSTLKEREKITELAFEQFDVPALFLARNAVLSAFAHGRTTCLVLDSGSSMTSAVPVYDGYVLKKGIHKQPLGGDLINQFIIEDLKNLYNYDVTPTYLIKSKQLVDQGQLPKIEFKNRENTTPSFHKFMQLDAVNEFKESTSHVFEMTYDKSAIETRPGKPYEFNDGFNNIFLSERFKHAEILFSPQTILEDKPGLIGIPKLISDTINTVDHDLKPHMFNNLILTGGCTLTNGFNDRLSFELTNLYYGQRFKLVHGNPTNERRYTNWLGGSILASLGSFHQLWLSRNEYEESGTSIIEKKFA